jgi:parallel beta-helix repeat protein
MMLRQVIGFFLFALLAQSVVAQNLVINEFSASNSFILSDNIGEFDDWIEVHNPTASDINLAGYYFSDNPNKPLKWQVDSSNAIFTTVPAGGYLVFWADGDTLQGPTHLSFRLSSAGEFVSLVNPQGGVEDSLTYISQESDVSYSRIPDATGPFYFTPTPTAYAANTTIGYLGFVKSNPVFSVKRGVYESAQSLELTKDFVDGDVRYTLDGSRPTQSSPMFVSPISITQNTVVRAAVFEDSLIESVTHTHSYILGLLADQKVPVISIAGDSAKFYDPGTGLLTQTFLPGWEYGVNFEIMDVELNKSKSEELGVEILQEEEWQAPQKPLNFTAKNEFGKKSFKYQLFPEANISTFKSFTLRNAATDWGSTLLKDGFAQRITTDNLDLDNRFYQPASVYINGVWQGIYNLRPNTDIRYPAELYGFDKDSIAIIKGNGSLEGDPTEYYDWINLLQTIDLSDSLNFVSMSQQMDIENYTHNMISMLFFGNEKWATENAFQWKSIEANSRWRWFLRGMDRSMVNANVTNFLMPFFADPVGGTDNPEWLTRPFRKLLDNANYRTDFLKQLADQFYITFNPIQLAEELTKTSSEIDGYIAAHSAFWIGSGNSYASPIASYTAWNDSLAQLAFWFNNRGDEVRNSALSYFTEVSAVSSLDLAVQTLGAGSIALNNLIVPKDVWTGSYFDSLEFTLTAISKPGYNFVGWEGSGVTDTTLAQITLLISQNTSIIAHFEVATQPHEDVIINEIKSISDTLHDVGDWVEFYNPSTQWVNLSDWYFTNGNNDYKLPGNVFIAPDDYIVLANDRVRFLQWYSSTYGVDVSNQVYGNFDFGLGSDGGELRLIDTAGTIIDSVDYLAVSPWPVMNNPDTLSIELIAPSFDNAYGHNWFRSEVNLGTPLNPSSITGLHIGKIINQEINAGDAFVSIDLNDYIYSPNIPVDQLTINIFGNSNIQTTIDNQQVVQFNYANWQGVERIKFSISDSLGNSSIDSALFLVGTVLDQVPCNATYTIADSPILFTNSVTVPTGCTLTFEAGVEVRMEANTEFIIQGQLNFNGTAADSVYLNAHEANWNSILIDSVGVGYFYYTSVQNATHGSDSTKMNAAITGFYGGFFIENCTFLNTERAVYGYHGYATVDQCDFMFSVGEKVNFQFTQAFVTNSYFSPSFGDFDAIDFDAVTTGLIEGNYISYGEDDGIDIGQIEGVVCDSLQVIGNYVTNLADKAISVGEGSTDIIIKRNILRNSYYGIAVKDGSDALVEHNTIDQNNYAIALFEKNDGLEGSFAVVRNSILSNSSISTAFIDGTSSATFDYNCSTNEVLTGTNNFMADPGFDADYELYYHSPCINTGDPMSVYDPDWTIADVGAKWFNTDDIEHFLNSDMLITPNPAPQNTEVLISWSRTESGEHEVQIINAAGKLMFDESFSFSSVNPLQVEILKINTANMAPGVYMCRVSGPSDVRVEKFVVAP